MRPLLEKAVLLPCVFAIDFDSIPNVNLYHLKKMLFDFCVVCDTPDYACTKAVLEYAKSGNTRSHRHAKEVIEKLRKQGRLHTLNHSTKAKQKKTGCFLDNVLLIHSDDYEVFSNCQKSTIQDAVTVVGNINVNDMASLHKSEWLNKERSSIRLERSIDHFIAALKLLLETSKSINFIDPHLDPSRHDYEDFFKIFSICNDNNNCSEINIHRVCYTGSGAQKERQSREYWENIFRDKLQGYNTNNKAHVYIWPDFHDRFILTNLMGFSLPYGISTTKDTTELTGKTVWTKLSFSDNNNLQNVYNDNKLLNNNTNSYKFEL
ncbi:MAG: hypothetical protein LHW48_02735 [Candidatus Cloacimonetes bacterium]|nr:hypothetical protein [Candidatus Cloacimonadota bacterium]